MKEHRARACMTIPRRSHEWRFISVRMQRRRGWRAGGGGRGTRPWLGAWMCPTVDRSCLVLPTDGMDGLSTGVAEKLAWESLFDA